MPKAALSLQIESGATAHLTPRLFSGASWKTGFRRVEGGTVKGLAVALTGGRRIEVGRGFDAPTLVQLLGVLESD
jgi:hypothetical protein